MAQRESRPMEPIHFAIAGDIHGDHSTLIRRLAERIEQFDVPLAFILQVGDFEPVRDESDLATMPGPARRRTLGDFHRVLAGELHYPAEVLFIGGNHEPYIWLEEMPHGGEVAPGIRYIGRAAVVERYGLRIAGLSGIYSPRRYEQPVPPDWPARRATVKEPTYFRKPEVDRLLAATGIDLLLTHDWPGGYIGPFGNRPSRDLLQVLRPSLHVAGHMHRAARKSIPHPDGRESRLIALDHAGWGEQDVLVFAWDGETMREMTMESVE